MNEASRQWVSLGMEDLRMAELAMEESLWNQVCFHSQQCVEKMLKAVLADHGETIPRTHNLTDLLATVKDQAFDVVASDVRALDRFYIPTRYPDVLPGTLPQGLPSEDNAGEALSVARSVVSITEHF